MTSVLLARPATGGIGDVGAACARQLTLQGVVVEEVVLASGTSPALTALRAAWANRRAIRRSDHVQIELGILALPSFWFAVWSAFLRSDLLVVAHDAPVLVKSPGSGLIRTAPGLRDAIAHRVLAPLLDRSLLRWVHARSATFAVFNSDVVAPSEEAGLHDIRVVHHGGTPPDTGAKPSAGDYVLQIGYLGPKKGVGILLDAWKTLGPATPLPLWIVGEAADEQWWRGQRAVVDSLPNVLPWTGWVSDERFEEILSRAAVVVIPYEASNPASGILTKAKLHGRAIVATRVLAVKDQLADGVDSILVEPGDSAELARALDLLLSDAALRDQLGAAAARRAVLEHSWSRHVRDLYGAMLPCDPEEAVACG